MWKVAMDALLPEQLEVVVQTDDDPAGCDDNYHHLTAGMLVLWVGRIKVACCQGNWLPVAQQ
jgi:hypothetical protein